MHLNLNSNETIIYFNGSDPKAKKVLAYAYSRGKKVNEMDLRSNGFTTTVWHNILQMLAIKPKQLLDKSNPYYQENIKGREFDDEGWLKILAKTPNLLKGPILVEGDKAMLCSNASDIFKF